MLLHPIARPAAEWSANERNRRRIRAVSPLYAGNMHHHGTLALPRCHFERLLAEFRADCEVPTVADAYGPSLRG